MQEAQARLGRKIHPPQEVLEAGVGVGLQIFLFTPRLNAPLPNGVRAEWPGQSTLEFAGR